MSAKKAFPQEVVQAEVQVVQAPVQAPTSVSAVVVESTTVEAGGFKLDLTQLSPSVVTYLIHYGFAKSLQDSSAGVAKAEGPDAAQAKRLARFNALLDGTIGTRVRAASIDPIEKVMAKIVRENLVAAFAKAGRKMVTGEAYDAVAGNYLAKYGEVVKAEAERRMAASAAPDDLGDILGLYPTATLP